jgi:hypothetical protein
VRPTLGFWLAIGTALAVGQWSIANAGSSFKVVTAPADGQQAPAAEAGSSFKIVTLPAPAKQAQAETAQESNPAEQTPEASKQQSHVKVSSLIPSAAVLLTPWMQRQVDFDQPFSRVFVADPNVLNVQPLSDRSVILQPIKEGKTYVSFLDSKNTLVNSLEVTIDAFTNIRGKHPRDPEASPYASIELHNKAKLNSQTNYRCGVDGCHFVGELTVQEPAPLPAGWGGGVGPGGQPTGAPEAPTAAPPAATPISPTH